MINGQLMNSPIIAPSVTARVTIELQNCEARSPKKQSNAPNIMTRRQPSCMAAAPTAGAEEETVFSKSSETYAYCQFASLGPILF